MSFTAGRAVSVADFSESLQASFEGAALRFLAVRTLHVGTRRFKLRFASVPLLTMLVPAFARAEVGSPDEAADFTVDIWDSESTGAKAPRACWQPSDIGANGYVRGLEEYNFRAAFNLDSFCLSVVDVTARRCHFWMQSARTLPAYEYAAPLRTILAWSAQELGLHLAHAGCVANGSRGVLLIGRGGSGKSTAALSCIGSTLCYLADDYCALGMSSGALYAHSIYRTGKLDPSHLRAHLPDLAPLVRHTVGPAGKAVLYLDGEMTKRAHIHAIVAPVVGGAQGAVLAACSASTALSALGPSSVFQLPGLGAPTFRFMAEAVRACPCYTLTVGTPEQMRAALWGLVG